MDNTNPAPNKKSSTGRTGHDPTCDSSSEVSDEGYKSSQGQVSLKAQQEGGSQLMSNVTAEGVPNEKSSSSISKDSDVALSSNSSHEGNGELFKSMALSQNITTY